MEKQCFWNVLAPILKPHVYFKIAYDKQLSCLQQLYGCVVSSNQKKLFASCCIGILELLNPIASC